MQSKNYERASKFISLILRHNPDIINTKLEPDGWLDVHILLKGMNDQGFAISLNDLKNIVKQDEKQRYSFNETMSKIRANQGHSVDIKINFTESIPPKILYHGTSQHFIDSIFKNGIKKMQRNYVHLSSDIETATKVGSRHGKCVILLINTSAMIEDGIKFYISENKVWLTDYISPKYISLYHKEIY